jgi:hypothetical protein
VADAAAETAAPVPEAGEAEVAGETGKPAVAEVPAAADAPAEPAEPREPVVDEPLVPVAEAGTVVAEEAGTGAGTGRPAAPAAGRAPGALPAPESSPEAADVPAPADVAAPVPGPRTGEPVTYDGSGDRVVRITRPVDSGPVVAHIVGRGAGNLAVWSLDAGLEDDKLLVNAIGAYDGRALLDERGTVTERLRVESDGPWTITLHPPGGAPWLTGPVRGDGPEVLRWTGPRKVLAMTHHGASNFIVRVYAEAPEPGGDHHLASLANAIGAYDGESVIPAGPCLVEVEADGVWTLEPLDG